MIDPAEVGVEVTPSLEMIPLKSLTTVVGVGTYVTALGEICDHCSLSDTCRQKIA